jgi:D-xylose 1-dehydrogenase (NADP+, D-xylono-1,5-lactone-forming)
VAEFRWGIVGAARIARNQFVPGVRASKSGNVVAVASRDLERARAMAAAMEIPRAYGNYDELLADTDVDGVYIALPNSLHAEWTIRAARAGKHVLCEKPLARSSDAAHRMATACREAGVVLMEAFMWRHHPQHARVAELIREGAIGEPRMFRGSFSFTLDGPNVRLDPALEGGSLMDIGCYPVNVARWLFGSEPVGCTGMQVIEPTWGVDTSFVGVLRFDGDRLALIDSSFRQAAAQRYEVVGNEGSILLQRAFRPDADPGLIEIRRADRSHTETVSPANQYALEADHFVASVEAGRLLPPAENGVAQAGVIEALYAAAAELLSIREE